MDVPFNAAKFRELIVYVARQSADDPDFGATKLNKILFWSDFLSYGNFGRPITAATYQALDYGPAPRELLPERRTLINDGSVELVEEPVSQFVRKRLVAKRDADLSDFSADEIQLVDDIMKRMRGQGAKDASRVSHEQSMGWRVAAVGEDIPYQTVFVSVSTPTKRDIARGVERARALAYTASAA